MVEIRDRYQAARHPDVIHNHRTEDEILIEFLETFEVHHNLYQRTQATDGLIDLNEFMSYYRTTSCTVDDTDYFCLILNSVWGLKAAQDPYAKFEKGYNPKAK